MAETLMSVAALAAAAAPLRVIDCRFDLADPTAGEAAWRAAHLPGAVYAHLDRDLSGPPDTDHGRHPLPSPARLAEAFGRLGIRRGEQVVAYDAAGGSLAAARLWWLLRYVGHREVAVLDGGWQAWCAAGGPVESGPVTVTPTVFECLPRRDRRIGLEELHPGLRLLDARDPARFRGEHEPIDPRAGHIPGARNHCWRDNLGPDGCFLAPRQLHAALQASLGTLPDGETVHYCGSGVSACHNVLAQVHAGLPEPRLYCGSWSEWCRDPARPAATGTASGENTRD